jgi:hypothetical protein
MLSTVFRNVKNLPGKKTKRKIVVFFVDDYGSVRVKNMEAYRHLKEAGIPMDQTRFSRFDTLADKEDLSLLFDTLTSERDTNQNHACFTPFTIVANPDFEKIEASGFKEYYREPFSQTLGKYGEDYRGVFDLWKQGIHENIFYPAYHGTEHINVKRFMEALQNGYKSVTLAFKYQSVAIPPLLGEPPIPHPTATFFIEHPEENKQLENDIKVGTTMFHELFAFRSKQFTPGASIYSPALNKNLAENGIKYIHVNRFQAYTLGNGKHTKQFLYNGKQNAYGQKYIVRNCVFEPDGRSDNEAANRCLMDIEAAFRWGAPALISSHRVNFVGHFDKPHRNNSIDQLRYLLKKIIKRWPEVEFMNGDEMADSIL